MHSLKTRFTVTNFFNFIFVLSVCAFLTWFNIHLKLENTPAWFNGMLERNHGLLLAFDYTNNEQSRLFQFYIPELFRRFFDLSVSNAYIIQRVLFTFLTFFLFYFFCKKWFQNSIVLICTIALACLTPFTYENDLQESSSLLSLTFLLALWAIREKRNLAFLMILVVGSINNETMLYLPAVFFLVHFESGSIQDFLRLVGKTVLLALPAFIAVGIIRYINIDAPHLGGAWHFYENMDNLDKPFELFNVLWILAFLFYGRKSIFLQRTLLSTPLFILPHLITGIISETRQMLPLALIIMPAAVHSILEIKSWYRQNKQTIFEYLNRLTKRIKNKKNQLK